MDHLTKLLWFYQVLWRLYYFWEQRRSSRRSIRGIFTLVLKNESSQRSNLRYCNFRFKNLLNASKAFDFKPCMPIVSISMLFEKLLCGEDVDIHDGRITVNVSSLIKLVDRNAELKRTNFMQQLFSRSKRKSIPFRSGWCIIVLPHFESSFLDGYLDAGKCLKQFACLF